MPWSYKQLTIPIDKWDKAILETGYISPYKPHKLALYNDVQVEAAKKVWGEYWTDLCIDARDVQPPQEDQPLWDLI